MPIEGDSPAEHPGKLIFETDRPAVIEEALGAMEPETAQVMRLFLKGLKYEEIAKVLSISPEEVKGQIEKGARELQENGVAERFGKLSV